MTKQELRAAVRARKQAMSAQDITYRSNELCKLILSSLPYRQASAVYGYLPFNQEVDLRPLLAQALADGKLVALPKCRSGQMDFIATSNLNDIRLTSFGVPEPAADAPVACDPTALVIVPGLLFDRRGYRIGYGGGYYDRFLAREPHHPTLAVCYDFQLVDRLEPEPHDIPVQQVYVR